MLIIAFSSSVPKYNALSLIKLHTRFIIRLGRMIHMELLSLFSTATLKQAKNLYNQNKIIILKKDTHYIEAIIYDDFFYKVEITFNLHYTILYPRVSKDGFSDVDPFETPYAAALLYKLFRRNEYGLTYNYNLTHSPDAKLDGREFISSQVLTNMRCYNKLLKNITRYMLRLQNYNTDANITTFSNIIDDIFEYFDSMKKPQERLVGLQLFLHIYSHLEFNFDFQEEIHSAIVDECNYRIHEIIENEPDPTSKYFYQSILLTDDKIIPYISNYNKSSSLSH